MLLLMAKPRQKKTNRTESPHMDVFSRMDKRIVDRLDKAASAQHRSRSGMIAWLVEQYLETIETGNRRSE